MIRSASVTGAWHGSPRGRYRGCSSFRRVKTQEGFDAFTHRSPPAGEIGACDSRPAVWRWHINGLVGRTEVACGDELQRQIFGRPIRKTPQWLSALRNPLLPATLRAPETPPPCEPRKPPEHTLEGFLWYGHTGTIPAAAGCGTVVRKGSVRNLCTLPALYICFWQLYPVLHRRTSETRLPKRVLSESSVKAGFGGLRSVNAALPRTLRQPVVCSDSENRRNVKQGMAALFFSGPKAGFRFVPACAASVLRRAVRPVPASCGG